MRLLHYIPFDANNLVPKPEFFSAPSDLHGRLHVARVIILGAKLINLVNEPDLATPLWAASYIHDLGRKHDGYCEEHGTWSVEKVEGSDEIRTLLARGGVEEHHWPMIRTAAIHHCKSCELSQQDPHYRLTHLLKDADGLDRVRLGDLNPRYLRTPQAHSLIEYAESLLKFTTTECDGDSPELMSQILQRFHS